jgi:S2P endopeptidase
VQTRAFNAHHDTFSLQLASRNYMRTRRFLLMFYDIGSVLVIFGMFTAVILLIWTMVSLLSSTFLRLTAADASTSLLKRAVEVATRATTYSRVTHAVNPIIPGLTVPLKHLPLILLSLCISQIVHESGHAITAAIHRIPMLAAGASITFMFPAAFVTLPSARVEELSSLDRLRVITSGCYHNLTLWLILLATAWSGIGRRVLLVGYEDVFVRGLIVTYVEPDSPLSMHLPVGSFLTTLDDLPLNSSRDAWSTYLLEPTPATYKQGWCVDTSRLSDDHQCCVDTASSPSCFVSFENAMEEYCTDPVAILSKIQNRCDSSTSCLKSQSCIKPRGDQDILRITVNHRGAGTEDEHIVLWSGPRYEVWEQVQTTYLAPRFGIIPLKLPLVFADFFQYLKLTNLSLYLLNSLPLPALDGSQLLIILLEMVFTRWSHNPPTILDIEALRTRGSRPHERRVQRVLGTFVMIGTCTLLGSCVMLSIIEWMIV